MITFERSQRIFHLSAQINTAASELVAGSQPHQPTSTKNSADVTICPACAELLENGGAR